MSNDVGLLTAMQQHVPEGALAYIERAGHIARSFGEPIYMVGGVVRDILLGKSCLDIDLVVEGDAMRLAREVAGVNRLTTHAGFGTATLKCEGFSLDFVTARRETYSKPGALPAVKPSNINDDLFRRDFSVNAMAVCLSGERYGQLLDPWGGQRDLDSRLVRVLHDNSFADDATRILRALRYEQRLGFRLESSTDFMLRRDVAMLDTISGDRVRHELDRIMAEPAPEKALLRAGGLGVLERLQPGLQADGWTSAAFAVARAMFGIVPVAVYYALMVCRATPDQAQGFLCRLNITKVVSSAVRDVALLLDKLSELAVEGIPASRVWELLETHATHAVMAASVATGDERVRERLDLYLERLRHVKPSLKGDDLIRLGARPGPRVGELLVALRRAKLDGEVNSKAEETEWVRRRLGE